VSLTIDPTTRTSRMATGGGHDPAGRIVVREARDDDSWDLIGLIAACWADYPGCVLDVHGEMPWLLAPATSYAVQGGRLWVAERRRRVVGSVGYVPAREGNGLELRSLYVARPVRRQGLGTRLIGQVEAEARRRGAAFVELWSDTRFTDAHRLYERLGYRRSAFTRRLHDLSHTEEYHFRKELG
jgi:putative acetyltransferase